MDDCTRNGWTIKRIFSGGTSPWGKHASVHRHCIISLTVSSLLLKFVKSWLDPNSSGAAHILSEKQWFMEGHGIIGGRRDQHGIWIPIHASNGKSYIWEPPPVIADVALEECAKAIHKQTDAFHVILIPRLYSLLWLCMFYKLSDFIFHISPGSQYWLTLMHEPLFVSISLPILSKSPWTLRRMPFPVGFERDLQNLPHCSEAAGRDILCQLL
jgi:hypothetical protein